MLNSIKHVLSVHIFIYLVVYQSKYLYPPIARLSESVNQERALRPRHPGKGLQATASSPNLQGSLQVRTCKSEPSGQGLPATVPRPGPPGQGLQAMKDRASRPGQPGKGLQATASSPNLQGTVSKSGLADQSLQDRASGPGPQGHEGQGQDLI